MNVRRESFFVLYFLASLIVCRSAEALTFNLNPVGNLADMIAGNQGAGQQTLGNQVAQGFQDAGDRWESVFSDPITVNIDVNFANLGAGILGSTGIAEGTIAYSGFKSALTSDALSLDDASAVASLPAGTSFSLYLNRTSNSPNGSGSATPYIDGDGDANNSTIRMSLANARALGLFTASDSTLDAAITFSTLFSWDFNPTNGITGGSYDFVGVATHEIGHAMGFISGVDDLEFFTVNGGPFPDNLYTYVFPMDMFRFSSGSIGAQAGLRDWTADTRAKYFSLNSGVTSLGPFSTGATFGDGRQASHWKDNLLLGIMDPTAATGELLAITALDDRLLDVIGYDLAAETVPEPSALALAAIGLTLALVALRAKKLTS